LIFSAISEVNPLMGTSFLRSHYYIAIKRM